jgi:hypothetical protein
MRLPDREVADVFYVSLLFHVGCVGYAHETFAQFGDDLAVRRAAVEADLTDMRDSFATFINRSRAVSLDVFAQRRILDPQGTAVPCRSGKAHRGCQPAALVAVRETGLMWANMLRAFHVGKALTSDGRPSTWIRPSRTAWAHVSWPACHLTKASASAVM